MKGRIVLSLIVASGLVLPSLPLSAAKQGGLMGNSYSSQMKKVGKDKLRITTRKKVRGDLEEASTPGTTVYDALAAIQQAAVLRAAVEAKNLGYDVVNVVSARNLSQALDKRGSDRSPGGVSESEFAWGGASHYTQEVELVIEITVALIEGGMPESPPSSYIDVNETLKAFGAAQ